MSASSTFEQLAAIRVVPVVTIDDEAKAQDLAAALSEGGIPCAEITLRTPQGLQAIREIGDTPGFVLGAGSVVTVDQVEQCVDAGATFIVSPGFDDEVVERALSRNVAVLPGVATATEIQRAMRVGLSTLKFFPADRLGGVQTISSLAAPFPGVRFVPSGGVSPLNATEYLRHPSIFGISGSWMVPREEIDAGNFERIVTLCLAASALVEDVR